MPTLAIPTETGSRSSITWEGNLERTQRVLNPPHARPYNELMADTIDDLKACVEGDNGLKWIRGGGVARGWNNIRYKTGLSAKNVGSKLLSMNVATVPPGGVAFAHIHVEFELMLYILQGKVRHEYGPDLMYSVENQAGDFIFIEPGVPHEVLNIGNEDVVAVVARSAADEWDNIVEYPSNRRPGPTGS